MVAKCLVAIVASSVWKLSTGITSKILFKKNMPVVWLDEKEVEERGSQCLDGSVPTFHYLPGSTNKWIFEVHAPDGMCMSEKDCAHKLPVHKPEGEMERTNLLSLFDEEDMHRVYLTSCDFGMFLGDQEKTSNRNGHKLYFRGARIIKHIIDTLSANNTMREVLMIGASGGGQSVMVGAEYFRSIMPASVTKFGVAPLDGWYGLRSGDKFKDAFHLMGMQGTVNQACAKKLGAGDAHLCLLPATAYEHNTENMFVTQVLDYTFKESVNMATGNAWNDCFGDGEGSDRSDCDKDSVELLNVYLENFTNTFKTSSKHNKKGQGVFLSTCPVHVYYKTDDFWTWKNNGHTTGDAIQRWWKSEHAKWYWPCKLGSPPNYQCEPTCKCKDPSCSN